MILPSEETTKTRAGGGALAGLGADVDDRVLGAVVDALGGGVAGLGDGAHGPAVGGCGGGCGRGAAVAVNDDRGDARATGTRDEGAGAEGGKL